MGRAAGPPTPFGRALTFCRNTICQSRERKKGLSFTSCALWGYRFRGQAQGSGPRVLVGGVSKSWVGAGMLDSWVSGLEVKPNTTPDRGSCGTSGGWAGAASRHTDE